MAVPVALRRHRARQARRLDDDLGSVVHSRLGVVAERQPVALDLTGGRSDDVRWGWGGSVGHFHIMWTVKYFYESSWVSSRTSANWRILTFRELLRTVLTVLCPVCKTQGVRVQLYVSYWYWWILYLHLLRPIKEYNKFLEDWLVKHICIDNLIQLYLNIYCFTLYHYLSDYASTFYDYSYVNNLHPPHLTLIINKLRQLKSLHSMTWIGNHTHKGSKKSCLWKLKSKFACKLLSKSSTKTIFQKLLFSFKSWVGSMELTLTMTWPPPGVWWALSREPTLAWALSLKSNFTVSIRTWPPPGGNKKNPC